ncbi:lipid A biosynthesis acyltransferase, partial [Omnitrophica bacterium]|nr:lipid A biosynthesis acyltransferase [Candidatus Omnitrophota bacterium]
PIVPVFIVRQKNDNHKLIIEKPLEYELTGNNERDIKSIVEKAAGVIEKYVRLYPEQWFMFDNPWEKKENKRG